MDLRPKPKKKKYECPCGTDNAHKEGGNYQPTFDALNRIIADSRKAADAGEFEPAFSTWVANLRAVGPTFQAEGYKDLKEKLETMMRQEADWQAAGYREGDKIAGEVHGGRRGLVQEAQHQLLRAQEHLAEIKRYEAKKKKEKDAKKKEKDKDKKPDRREMSEAKAAELGAKRGVDGVNAQPAGAVVALLRVAGFNFATEPERHTVHKLDHVPEKHARAYYAALGDAARKRAVEIRESLKKPATA